MLRRLGAAASGGGGTARIARRQRSETPNVARSTPYVDGSPTTAIRTPPSAGPSTIPSVMRSDSSAFAADNSSRLTSRGVSAASDGRCRPSRPAISAATTKSTQSCGSGSSAFPSSSAVAAISESSVSSTSRRRSIASASAPPRNAVTSSGASSASPSSPTTSDEPLSR